MAEMANEDAQEFENVFVFASLNVGCPPAGVTVQNFQFGNINDQDTGTEILPSNFSHSLIILFCLKNEIAIS